MIDWKNVDFEKLDAFEKKAYRLCKYDNIFFDCSEKLCSQCLLCPLDCMSGKKIEPHTMIRIYQLFLRLQKAHDIKELNEL